MPRWDQLILSAEVSPARTSASPDEGQDSPARAADSGITTTDSLTNSGRHGLSSKMSVRFELADWSKYSKVSMRSGMMRNGTVSLRQPLAPLTRGIASGLWPTPRAQSATGSGPSRVGHRTDLQTAVKTWPTPTSRDWKDGSASSCRNVPVNGLLGRAVHIGSTMTGSLNPTWVEWLMGLPAEWTDLSNSETQ